MNFKILKVFTIIAINTLYFYNFIRYLQKIQLLAFHTLILSKTTSHSHYFLGNTLKFLPIIKKERLGDIYFKRNINLQVTLNYFNLIFYNLNNYTRHNNLIKRGFIYVFLIKLHIQSLYIIFQELLLLVLDFPRLNVLL